MPRTQVTQDQFDWDGKHIIHKPTGARFSWSYPNPESDSVTVNWGKAGDVLDNGDDYDRDDVYRVAMELLNDKRQRSDQPERHQ